ncbi:hypothetical protein N9P96_00015 [bacterium]|nr:hypothetical protein [bacterium]
MYWALQVYLFLNIFKRYEDVQPFSISIIYIISGIVSIIPGKIAGFLILEFIANRFNIKLLKTTSIVLYFQLLSLTSSFVIVALNWRTLNTNVANNICSNIPVFCINFPIILLFVAGVIVFGLFWFWEKLAFYFVSFFKVFFLHLAFYILSWHTLTGAAYALFVSVSPASGLGYTEFMVSYVLSYSIAQLMIVFPAGLGAFEILFVSILDKDIENVGAFLVLYRGLILGIQILLASIMLIIFNISVRLSKNAGTN